MLPNRVSNEPSSLGRVCGPSSFLSVSSPSSVALYGEVSPESKYDDGPLTTDNGRTFIHHNLSAFHQAKPTTIHIRMLGIDTINPSHHHVRCLT